MKSFPTYFKNPFIESVTDLYLSVEIFKNITYADFAVIPLSQINSRVSYIRQTRLIGADTRYPIIIYKSHFDALYDKTTAPLEYCIFDGTHRFLKMKTIEKRKGAGVFIITPKHFEGLKPEQHSWASQMRTTGCGGCVE
jgi:hypothetical protein|tara:strand:- start:841 stop:1257 length:417 start_codon:yes stop_codon:yes gene_type:complete